MNQFKAVAALSSKLYQQKYIQKGVHIHRARAEAFFDTLLEQLFPQLQVKGPVHPTVQELYLDLNKTQQELNFLLRNIEPDATRERIYTVTENFFDALCGITDQLEQDVDFAFQCDPASETRDQIIICYPGFYALSAYRIANYFYKNKVPVFPRLISEYAHRKTGIDINPGATIDAPFFTDHGTGLVIGETSHIGKRVRISQNVTLGAISVYKELQSQKRHPTIEDDVHIYSNCTILGGKTVIGRGSIIESNVWITRSVPPNTRVSQVKKNSEEVSTKSG